MNKAAKFLLEFYVYHDCLPEEKRKFIYYCALVAGIGANNKEMIDFMLDIRLFSLAPDITRLSIKEKLLDRTTNPASIGFNFTRSFLLHGAYTPWDTSSPKLAKKVQQLLWLK